MVHGVIFRPFRDTEGVRPSVSLLLHGSLQVYGASWLMSQAGKTRKEHEMGTEESPLGPQ